MKEITVESLDHLLLTLSNSLLNVQNIAVQPQIQKMIKLEAEKAEKRLQEEKALYTEELHRLSKEIATKKEQIVQSQIALQELSAQFQNVQKITSFTTAEILDAKHEKEMTRMSTLKDELITTLKVERDRERANHEKDLAKIKDLEEKINARKTTLANSQARGRVGEKNFQELLFEQKGWTAECISGVGHGLDFSLRIHDIEIRFDTKNHESSNIPYSDVTKLKTDMRNHPEVDVGVLVALNKDITNIDDLSIEWTPMNQLLVYIPKFLDHDTKATLNWLDLLFRSARSYRKLIGSREENDSHTLEKEKEKVQRVISYIQNMVQRNTVGLKTLKLDKKALQDKLDILTDNVSTLFTTELTTLQTMLGVLKGDEETVEGDKEEMVEEKPKSRRKAASKAKTTIQSSS